MPHTAVSLPLALAAALGAWALTIPFLLPLRLAVVALGAQLGLEAAPAFAYLFGALVPLLIPGAAGLLSLALAALAFSCVAPLLAGPFNPARHNRATYAAI